MLDRDLAKIYGVPTKVFNQAVKRNRSRFPEDFMFRLTREEAKALQVLKVTNCDLETRPEHQISAIRLHRIRCVDGREYPEQLTRCSDEYDVRGRRWMDCIVRLGNGRAIGRARVNIFVVRAFAKMREALRGTPELARKLAALEKKLTSRLDVHEAAIVEVLQELMQILNPPALPPKPRIGFTP